MSTSPYQRAAIKAAKTYGIPPKLFQKLINQESGWDATIRSPAGATGLTQLMPATAASLGVNPLDPIQNLDGGARYLSQQYQRFGSWTLALAAYNAGPGNVASGEWRRIPETVRYVHSILGSQPGTTVTKSGGIRNEQSLPPAYSTGDRGTKQNLSIFSDEISQRIFDSLGKIAMGWKPTSTLPYLTGVPLPSTTLPGSFSPPGGTLTPGARAVVGTTAATTVPRAATTTQLSDWVRMAPGADRQGVPTHQSVLTFVASIAQRYGQPLTIGTGSNHNRYVVDRPGVQSDHWLGNAADIPMSGAALTRLGRDALIAAGASPSWARRQKGGVFNIGRYQILFNTTVGGNHFNHLHVGVR